MRVPLEFMAVAFPAVLLVPTVVNGQDVPKRILALTCDGNPEHFVNGDKSVRVQQMLDMAWKCWLDYDAYENRNNGTANPAREGDPAQRFGTRDRPRFVDPRMSILSMSGVPSTFPIEQIMLFASGVLREGYAPFPFAVAGEADYLKAKSLATAAYRLDPANEQAFRILAQLAVARLNWTELRELAATHTQRNDRGAWPGVVLALASYRLQPGKEAGAKLEAALALLPAPERARLDRFERLLRPKEAAAFAKLDSASRAATIRTTWLLADPLWSVSQADPRTEFLARVIFAELRWTVDDEHRGADSDRGDIYIRYGPPNQIMAYVGTNTQIGHLFWIYNAGIAFAFQKSMHYGTARFAPADADYIVERMKDWVPARWDNIATSRIDSMPTQLARFRSGSDTVEVLLATRAPMEAIALVGTANTSPIARLWLYGLDTPAAFVDSVKVGESGRLQWTRRLGAGSYYYRVESSIPNTLIAGRAAAAMKMGGDTLTGFAMRGFGLSDVLLATKVNSTLARRWVDFDAEPLLGDVKKGSDLSLVWETYELGERDRQSRYEVAVTIERGQSGMGKIAARIVSRVASIVGVDATDDKLALKFDRVAPYATTIADNITISIGDTPAGVYLMTLRITDRVTGRAASRSMTLVITD
jgi:GWxTD domain-containing protein